MAQSYQFTPILNGGSLTCTTSYQAIPNLTFNVAVGATYRWQIFYQYQGATAATSVFQPTMAGTCTASFVIQRWSFQNNANSATNSQITNGLGLPTTLFAGTAVNAAATNYAVMGDGIMVVSASGTFAAQAASKAASPNNCTVQSGGMFFLEQVA